MKRKAAILRGAAGIMAFLFFLCTAATTLTFHYAGVINQALGVSTTQIIHSDDAAAAGAVVYDNEYGTDPSNNQAALMLEMDVAAENIRQAEEGSVLLTNNGALPLAEGAGVTLFGNGAFHPVGTSTSTPFESIAASTLTSALQDALGAENVNATLGDTAYASLGTTSITSVAEAPIAGVRAQESSWQSSCNDAAIVVLSRAGSESNDASLYNDDGDHYLGLSDNEADLMAYLQSQKESGVFGSIIVLINSEQAMELDWLDDYGVDACMLVGRPGAVGYTGVVNLLVGAANPSGRVVDTYAANSLSAPAVTYAGNNTQQWSNLDWVAANNPDWGADGTSESNWILYAEGIYTGYKYYETRYEDTVLGAGNAASAAGSSTGGAWSYSDEVVFSFGHGLSYTTFTQTLDSVEYDPNTDSYLVDVTVTNTGGMAGMDVVEVYAQTPYGDYEKQNRVEKAAVQFVGMGKTDTMEPGESETVTVEVDRYFLASYDAYGAAGYILSAGDYYLAIGSSAHDALNNILAAKGFTTADGMDYDGDAGKTYTWNQAELDTESYDLSRITGVEVTNLFDKADINYYGYEFTYLSRSDWEGTYPAEAIEVAMTEEMLEDAIPDWYNAADYDTGEEFTFGADNGLTFADLYYTDFDDEETWNAFLDQLTVEEMLSLISDNDGYDPIESVGMPGANRTDDNTGIGNLVCNNAGCIGWVSEVTTSRTWNTERFDQRGRLLGVEALFCGATEIWYGGGDLHRTPFGGRNHQYWSEDGNFGYIVGTHEAAAMQAVGTTFCIKHFALNDQDYARDGVATFTNEQALRENYLRAFEGAFCEGGALSVMTAFNRIGCVPNNANSALLDGVLRGEWGFQGHVTSDGYSSYAYKNHFAEFLVTGQDYYCLDAGAYRNAIQSLIDSGDTAIISYLREAAKHDLYVLSRTWSINGLTSGSTILTIVPGWQKALLIATAVLGVGFVACTAASAVMVYKKKHIAEVK